MFCQETRKSSRHRLNHDCPFGSGLYSLINPSPTLLQLERNHTKFSGTIITNLSRACKPGGENLNGGRREADGKGISLATRPSVRSPCRGFYLFATPAPLRNFSRPALNSAAFSS
jgi:hypothetical protein